MKRTSPLFLYLSLSILLSACAPRPAVIEAGVAATLTALAPTSFLPAGRPTSTPVPTVILLTPSETPMPTDTPQPTATQGLPPTEEPTTRSTSQAGALGALIFEDTFSSPGPWAVGDAGDSNVTVSGGVLTYIQKKPGTFSYRIIGKQASDFYAEISAALPRSCGSGDKFGLMFRVQDADNFYSYLIDCDGRYRLARYVGGAATPLLDWTPSSAIKRGANALNLLAVRAQGSGLTLFVNGVELASASDSIFPSGKFGLWVASNISNNLTVVFDDLRVYQLP